MVRLTEQGNNMLSNWIKKFRRKHFPTDEERTSDGKAYFNQMMAEKGKEAGLYYISRLSLDYDDPFDKGIINAYHEYMERTKWQ